MRSESVGGNRNVGRKLGFLFYNCAVPESAYSMYSVPLGIHFSATYSVTIAYVVGT